jgi:fluoride exporter
LPVAASAALRVRGSPKASARAPASGRGPRSSSTSSGLLGYSVTRLQERLPLSLYRRPFLATGLCGALTTFSTVMVEVLRMFDGRHWLLASSYTAASVACGFAAVFASTKLVRRARIAT